MHALDVLLYGCIYGMCIWWVHVRALVSMNTCNTCWGVSYSTLHVTLRQSHSLNWKLSALTPLARQWVLPICLPPAPQRQSYGQMHLHPAFCVGPGDSNSDLRVCRASTVAHWVTPALFYSVFFFFLQSKRTFILFVASSCFVLFFQFSIKNLYCWWKEEMA